MSYEPLFTQEHFAATITSYCEELGWHTSSLDDTKAVFSFEMPSGRTLMLNVIRLNTLVIFIVPFEELTFGNLVDSPHYFSSLLLVRNAEAKVGYWCIRDDDEEQAYCYNAMVDKTVLSTERFKQVAGVVLAECDNIGMIWEETPQILREQPIDFTGEQS